MQKIAVCDESPQDIAAVVGQALPLAHGLLAANPHGVGIVDNPVANSICQKRVRQLLRPSPDVKLEAEARRVSLVPGLHVFQ